MQSGYIKKLIQKEVKILFEGMELFDAIKIFEKYSGIKGIAGLSSDDKTKLYKQLIAKYHPDNQVTGNEEISRQIQEAYLKISALFIKNISI